MWNVEDNNPYGSFGQGDLTSSDPHLNSQNLRTYHRNARALFKLIGKKAQVSNAPPLRILASHRLPTNLRNVCRSLKIKVTIIMKDMIREEVETFRERKGPTIAVLNRFCAKTRICKLSSQTPARHKKVVEVT